MGYARCPSDGEEIRPLDHDPLIGKTIAERYCIETCVGEGAMGRVYRARHVRLSRRFAIKVLFGDLVADPTMRSRFAREAEAASRLDHPNIASTVDFGDDQGLLYLAMDYIDGDNLRSVIHEQGAFSQERTADLVRQLAEGLSHAHNLGLVHRDFKAENVLIVKKGTREIPTIVDFGLAILPETTTTGDRLTTAGVVIGTPAYMSPEQATDAAVDHRADLYALGVLTYEMLAGRLPFDGSGTEIARHNVLSEPPPFHERAPGVVVDAALSAIVFRLLKKKPDERFDSADDVIFALDEWRPVQTGSNRMITSPPLIAAAEPAVEPAPTVTAETQNVTTTENRGRTIFLAAAVAIVVLGGLVYALGLRGGDDGSGEQAAVVATDAGHTVRPILAPPSVVVDAAVAAAAVVPADASIVAAAPPDATPAAASTTKSSRRSRRAQRKRASKMPPPPKEISAEQLRTAYSAAGKAVDLLEREQGAALASRYRKRYLAISFMASLRDPDRRKSAYRKLRQISAAVRRARRSGATR